jgi:hypothetical protein
MAPPGYRSRLQDELARKTRARAGMRQVELDEHVLGAAARTSASVLSISDVAADALKNERREIPKHINLPARGNEVIYGA